MRVTEEKNKRDTIILSCLFLCFLLSSFALNIRYMNRYLTSDMYGDLWVAKLMWEQKTLFPQNWVFGNQIYILATPNLAALFYGVTEDMLLSMGLASSIMVLVFIGSYYWMLKPFMSLQQILIGLVALFSCFCTVDICSNQYAQLYFIGCTYYSCYAIALLINIGVLARIFSNQKMKGVSVVFAIILSFAMGLQSSRQTLIMVLPFIFIAICYLVICRIQHRNANKKMLAFVAATSVFNIAGVLLSKRINVERDAIIGGLGFSPFYDISGKIISTARNVISLAGFDDVISFVQHNTGNAICVCLMGIAALAFLIMAVYGGAIWLINVKKHNKSLSLIYGTLLVSCLAVFGAFMTIDITRLSKYYFIFYILTSVLIASVVNSCKGKRIKPLFSLVALVVLIVSYILPIAKMESHITVYEEIAAYMEDNNYSIVYSEWDNAGNVAGASDCRIVAGRWDASDIFTIKAHTNVLDIYSDYDNERALYLMTDETLRDAEKYFAENECEVGFECLATFLDENGNMKYLYKSGRQLMKEK